ncbi:response regulator transcription factor [Ilumatobacter nonamiensis]|uniref:response regulator transcription factor n=1 Tax=Ilumatobacter nonamiensis TaxID=467093 RepID=UPI00058FF8D8|nr:response regulator transcription factor [Ilumatobacter nonamiensis]
MARILLAEDDAGQAFVLQSYLEHEGHDVRVAGDGLLALAEYRRSPPDLIVLDVMMPGLDGVDLCRLIRSESPVPIIMVTAKTDESDVLAGLDVGADDYVAKPYSPRLLVARIRAALRRSGLDSHLRRYEIGELVVDAERFEAALGGTPVDLTPREFGILAALATGPGRAFTRREILDLAVGFDHYALERTVDMHLFNLRRKIEHDATQPRYVLTVRGRGYKLADE